MNKKLIAYLLPALLVALHSALSVEKAAADKDNAYAWKSRVSSVTVFKNGLGFFLRDGEVTLRDGWCVADAVPPAAFGTLAIFSHGKDQVVDLVGSGPGEVVEFDGADAGKDAATKRARLEAVRYLKVQLTYGPRDAERTAAGRLASVGTEYAVLEADSNSFAVPVERIRKLQVLEKPLRVHVTADNGRSPEKATLGMAYLRKGVTWIPEYTLKLLDDDTAELTLRGTLVNEAEDLVHADVNFVVGVPHFFHTDYLAPVAVGQLIRTIGAAVAPPQVMSQIMNRAVNSNDIRANQFDVVEQSVPTGGRDLREALGNLPQLEAADGSDFTVYTRKDLTVRRGEKAIVTLFTKKIKYGHIYRWSPPQSVEHFLVLQNSTDTPWTTGPCLVVSDGKALSEDLLSSGTSRKPVRVNCRSPPPSTSPRAKPNLRPTGNSKRTSRRTISIWTW